MHRFLIVMTALAALPAAAVDFGESQWYAQGVVALPTGDFSDFANLGFGGGGGVIVPIDESWSLRGEASYIWFSTDDIGDVETSASLIPLTALAEYAFPDSDFYVLGGVSVSFFSAEVEVFGMSESDTTTEFGLVAGAGYRLTPALDLNARFNVVSDANQVTLHVAYRF